MQRSFCFLTLCGLVMAMFCNRAPAEDDMPQFVQSIEGFSEFQLDNGLQVLLFPDDSKPLVTVNMTVLVGSRHEGYGEAGMAHLLEHMLFQGTDANPQIPKALQDRGARFNGTTWLDRTNYYETLTATADNLEFAIALEADRLVNSRVRGEDLNKEMTVVRSEFESGENSPQRVLQQRIFSTAYEWHNYGKTTIGNRSDIERVPIDALRRFYKKYYRPDNVILVVAGKFDPESTLGLVQKYFGILENPEGAIERTYTVEPPQDGERTTVVRRVGETQLVGVGYHIPAASDPTFAAVDVLATALADEPSGRLYKAMVEGKKASSIYGGAMALHDPGFMFFLSEVPKEQSLEEARATIIQTLEQSLKENPITEDEVARIKRQILKDRELKANDVQSLAIELSEWASQGDWRLYFLYRDRIEAVTAADVEKVANYYLTQVNRTVGLFIPSEKSEKLLVPEVNNLEEMLAGYTGREVIESGEAFDPTYENIEARTTHGEVQPGFTYALLPKKSRGGSVKLILTLRFGNEESLFNKSAACEMLADVMSRGTADYTYQQLRDKLDSLLANVNVSSQPQLLTVQIDTKRENLVETLSVIESILRRPSFVESEFEILKTEAITSLQSQLTEPDALGPTAVARAFNNKPKGHIHYSPTIEEEVAAYQSLTIHDVKDLYTSQLGASRGELSVVGDFDSTEVVDAVSKIIKGWSAPIAYKRVDRSANVSVAGQSITIETPDKANSLYYASEQFAIKDDHPDYAPLVIGNYVLGAGALSSRLGDRVRQRDGLSYGIASGLNAHPVDERATLTVYAIANPANRDKVVTAIEEEIKRIVTDGITQDELEQSVTGFLQKQQVSRAEDRALAAMLSQNMFAKRDLNYQKNFDAQIAELTVDRVNAVIKKYIDYDRLVIATAGDFANAAKENPAPEVEPVQQ